MRRRLGYAEPNMNANLEQSQGLGSFATVAFLAPILLFGGLIYLSSKSRGDYHPPGQR